MTIKLQTKELQQAIALVAPVAASKSPVPTLQGIHLESDGHRLTLRASDLEVWIETSIECIGSYSATVLDAKKLALAVKACTGETTTFASNTVSSGRFSAKVDIIEGEHPTCNHPDAPFREDESLLAAIQRVRYATSTDPARPHMCCALVTHSEVVATDGHRLHVAQRPRVEMLDAKIGRRLADLLARHDGACEISQGDDIVSVRVGETTYVGREVAGAYPQHAKIMPKRYDLVLTTVERKTWIDAIKQAATLKGRTNVMRFEGNGSELVISLNEAEVVMPFDKTVKFAVNPAYMLDALQSLTDEHIRIQFPADPLKPIVIVDETDMVLIMPMRW